MPAMLDQHVLASCAPVPCAPVACASLPCAPPTRQVLDHDDVNSVKVDVAQCVDVALYAAVSRELNSLLGLCRSSFCNVLLDSSLLKGSVSSGPSFSQSTPSGSLRPRSHRF